MPEPVSQNEILIEDVGNTYQADHAQANGNIAESEIDHVYTTTTTTQILPILWPLSQN